MVNVKTVAMEDKIFDIVTDLIRDDITKDEAIAKLLVLHNVSHRFNFEGQLIDPTKVVGVGKVKTFSTGSLSCDWDFGFKIKCIGNNIKILVPTETDSMGNHKLKQSERIEVANKVRDRFIAKLNGG